MPRQLGVTYRLLGPSLRGYAKLDGYVERARRAASNFLEGFVLSAFEVVELTDLTIALYTQSDWHAEALFLWERPWFERALPRPPARVLVAAAGAGREVAGLRAAGYEIDAFEPAAPFAQLQAAVGSGLALRGTFADLVRAYAGEPSPLAALATRRYDAILLGWGSLSHVPDPRAQRELLAACHALCPRGPILASFVAWSGVMKPANGRARSWGVRTGALVGRARRVLPNELAPGTNRFWLHGGVIHVFERAELEALGRSIGRSLVFEPMPYAHATWLPALAEAQRFG